MIRVALAAAVALLVASPAAAQSIGGCAIPPTNQIDKSTDRAALQAGIDCIRKAQAIGDASIARRQKRLDALAAAAPAPSKPAGLVAEGDSITVEWGGNYAGLWRKAHPGAKFTTLAVSGARISDPTGGNGLVQRLPALLAAKPAVVSILIGANDLGDGQYATPDAWLSALRGYVAQVKGSGAKVAVFTVLPLCFDDPKLAHYVARHAQRRPIANAGIRADAASGKIDAVIEAADLLGGDKAPCTGRALFKDGIHPSDSNGKDGGQDRLYGAYAPVVDKLLNSRGTAAPTPAAPAGTPVTALPAAIPSNFDRTALILGGAPIPPSAAPDVVGAFRFICQAGQLLKDDPIVWPGQPGKAHALHQFFGNLSADTNSTFASLRAKGESTCMNELNRSAYWMPAMINAALDVIRPDFISVYYKRRPASDPDCRRMAKACVGLPNGMKLIAGFDHDRTGPQPAENRVFHWRCAATSEIHRDNLTDALADCGGAGQVLGTVNFGSCWNGAADSTDHRSHVVHLVRDVNSGLEQCPAGYDQIIPELTQTMAWTVAKADGAVRLSSDPATGKAGTTLHADYMPAWDEPTLAGAMANCIDKLRNASDGDLCDGTIMKRRAGFGYTANPRVVPAPAGTVMAGMMH